MRRLRSTLATLLLVALAVPAAAQQPTTGFFPYPVHKRTLANGLDVIVIPMPQFRDVLSWNTLVVSGSRNEVEKGKSGLAHLFEHILFSHRMGGKAGGYDEVISRLGAFNNASTWADQTYYYPLTFASNLEEIARAEADRFVALDFDEATFRTQAGAVLGEYRNNAANPGLRMSEVANRLMYGDYGYGHTTIGYLEDVQDMPNEYQAALKFYRDWYTPTNSVLIVAGDVKPDSIFRLAERLYGGWKRTDPPALPDAAPVGGPKKEHIDWATDVPPRVSVAHRIPAHRTGSVDAAVAAILPEILTGPTSPLVQELRFRKRVATGVGSFGGESLGPGSYTVGAVLLGAAWRQKGNALLAETEADILAAIDSLKSFSSRQDAVKLLEDVKSKYAYDLLGTFESPAAAARQFAWYYKFERDPQVFDRMIAAVRALTPADVDRFVRAHFVPGNRVTVTLAPKPAGS